MIFPAHLLHFPQKASIALLIDFEGLSPNNNRISIVNMLYHDSSISNFKSIKKTKIKITIARKILIDAITTSLI